MVLNKKNQTFVKGLGFVETEPYKSKEEFADQYGRWVEDNEIVIEDLSEFQLLDIAKTMAKKGYHVEYWKAPKQDSGHVHIKNIKFPDEMPLSLNQKRKYKLEIMKKYVPKKLWNKTDWNFITAKRHRIATENEEHFKGYGVKELVKEWNGDKENIAEQEEFMRVYSHSSRDGDVKISKPDPSSQVELLTYSDFKKMKKNTNFIVEEFLHPSTTTMIYSPPANFKSIIALTLGMTISNGVDWLNLKTKKQGVLYLDGENSPLIIKERLEQVHEGYNLKNNKFPFYVIQNGYFMDPKKNINLDYLTQLEDIIRENKIKVMIVDTLHRFAYYDENKADDINLLYTQVFKPLIEEFGISIVFLHHSTKSGGYRGSGDFLGMVDVSYQVRREGKTDKFRIINEKCRSGEIQDLFGEVDFQEDSLRLFRMNEKKEVEKKVKKIKEVTMKVKSMIKESQEYQRKDIISSLDIEEFDYGTVRTIDRSLKWLMDNSVIDKNDKGRYFLL